jgi:putative phage-type endonuclease
MEYNKAEQILLMNPDIQIHRIATHSPEWYAFRMNGIGSSETATVLGGMHEYESPIKLYHEKTGSVNINMMDAPPMFWGRTHEPNVANVWQYYDGTEQGYLENFNKGIKIRECVETSYITNKKYPWLFSSPDRLIVPPFQSVFTGEIYEKVGNLEVKTLSYHAAKKWESKIPIYYIAQVHQQMIVLETEYTELAILRDGNKLDVIPVYLSDALRDRILEATHDFWYNRVVPGKEVYRELRKVATRDRDAAVKLYTKFQDLEPPPDDTKAYEEFMDSRFVDKDGEIKGNLTDYSYVKLYNWYLAAEAIIKAKKQYIKNHFISRMDKNDVNAININDRGYARYGKKGTNGARSLTINYPVKPSKIIIEKQIMKIDKKY